MKDNKSSQPNLSDRNILTLGDSSYFGRVSLKPFVSVNPE